MEQEMVDLWSLAVKAQSHGFAQIARLAGLKMREVAGLVGELRHEPGKVLYLPVDVK